ncbi:MaoC/PaaZ C-terminal domain-containing protein [Aeromicrobium endophyticum]|uniref:Dehydratase n=1 Tax=Aeromicrobium endophyticum TaxID=2292704 RepID=A0A371PCP7_9ACTN|nr:MaoC/PaaZ C-terminal domain-containing protein [Aeromicrobium endophyticum]REK73702.1 dehydratase [Aeromicrobium endophyticum]
MTYERVYAEDVPVRTEIELGEHRVTRGEIIAFARQWDPQPFHVDEEFARGTVFGDLIGSGLHTMAIFQRLAVTRLYRHWAIIAGRAINDVRMTRPLRPDTTVRATVWVDSVEPDSPSRSLMRKTGTVWHGDHVMMTIGVESYIARRLGDEGASPC